jgi:hypothetical protein
MPKGQCGKEKNSLECHNLSLNGKCRDLCILEGEKREIDPSKIPVNNTNMNMCEDIKKKKSYN